MTTPEELARKAAIYGEHLLSMRDWAVGFVVVTMASGIEKTSESPEQTQSLLKAMVSALAALGITADEQRRVADAVIAGQAA